MTITITGWDWLYLLLCWVGGTYLNAFLAELTRLYRNRKKGTR
jgi:hypothetical protein